MTTELDRYIKTQRRIAREKADDTPASIEMHRMVARWSRVQGRQYVGSDWPVFVAWCRQQLSRP